MSDADSESRYALQAAELSALYEVASFHFAESEESLFREAVHRAYRLFPVNAMAIVRPGPEREVVISIGIRPGTDVFSELTKEAPNRFIFSMCRQDRRVVLLMEQSTPLSARERRMYTVFARRLEDALVTTRNIVQRRRVEEELRRHRQNLERVVHERTEELEHSNRRLREEMDERMRAEEARREMERRVAEARERELMERTGRLAAMGLLAAGIAHEVNNPLQGMLSHLSAVKRALPADFPRARSLEMVETGMQTISSLIRRLLAFSSERDVRWEPTECGEALDFVVELLEPEFRKGNIVITSPRDVPRLNLAIPQRDLVQVLLNIFINARDAMPRGGRLSVGVAVEGSDCRIVVRDTGQGIPQRILGQIFTPFFTTKGRRGTGLGLSVAEAIVRRNGGRIEVESQPGKGSAFHVVIPLAGKVGERERAHTGG